MLLMLLPCSLPKKGYATKEPTIVEYLNKGNPGKCVKENFSPIYHQHGGEDNKLLVSCARYAHLTIHIGTH